MSKLMISAAAAALVIAFAVPASAERNWGPVRQNGQCWHSSPGAGGPNAGTWGYWEACAQAASTVRASGNELRRPLRPRRDQHNDR